MQPIDLNRIGWHSRRGMLELDLLLVPFAEHEVAALTPAEQQLYQQLLTQTDQTLYAWLISQTDSPAPEFVPLVNKIRACKVSPQPGPLPAAPSHSGTIQTSFALKFSYYEAALKVICYGLAIPAPWLASIPGWAAFILSGLLLALAWQDLRQLRPGTRLRGMTLYQTGAILHYGQHSANNQPPVSQAHASQVQTSVSQAQASATQAEAHGHAQASTTQAQTAQAASSKYFKFKSMLPQARAPRLVTTTLPRVLLQSEFLLILSFQDQTQQAHQVKNLA